LLAVSPAHFRKLNSTVCTRISLPFPFTFSPFFRSDLLVIGTLQEKFAFGSSSRSLACAGFCRVSGIAHPDGHFSRHTVTHVLQQSTRGVPASWALSRRLFDLAPVGVCRAAHVAVSAVGSYPAFSPLPADCPQAVCFLWHCPSYGKCTPRNYLATSPSGARTFLDGITTLIATTVNGASSDLGGEVPSSPRQPPQPLQAVAGATHPEPKVPSEDSSWGELPA
jgi:hypothetical protein